MSKVKKELKNLLNDYAKGSRWSANDTLKWLKKVHEVLMNCSEPPIPCKFSLAKRLGQCLGIEGADEVHALVISITARVFDITRKSEAAYNECLGLFSGGLLPFYQITSAENKLKVVELVSAYFLPLEVRIAFAVPGLVCSLLPTSDDDQPVYIEDHVKRIFYRLGEIDMAGLMGAMWQALLRTPRVRRSAMAYLAEIPPRQIHEKLPQPELVVNGFIACLNDENRAVKRAVLKFLLTHFPIDNEVLSDEMKVSILEAILLLMKKSEDSATVEKIWEWCFSGQAQPTDASILPVLVPVLGNIFSLQPTTSEEAAGPLNILEALLAHEALCAPLLSEATELMLTYACNLEGDLALSAVERARELFNRSPLHQAIIWQSLEPYLRRRVHRAREALRALHFFISKFVPDQLNPVEPSLPLLAALLSSLSELTEDSISDALALIQFLLGKLPREVILELGEALNNFHSFFRHLCQNVPNYQLVQPKDFDTAGNIAITLEKYSTEGNSEEWVECFFTLMDSEQLEISLIGIDGLVFLINSSSNKYARAKERVLAQENVCKLIIDRLWNLLTEESYRRKCAEIIINLYEANPGVFTQTIVNELSGNNISKGIKHFSIFWKTASEHNKEKLKEMFSKGAGILHMLDHLNHPNAEIKHYACKWVIDSLENYTCLLDPIFEFLLGQVTLEVQGSTVYIKTYDVKIVHQALKKLKSIVTSAPQLVFEKALRPLSKNLEEKLRYKLPENSYMRLMVEVPLYFIKSESTQREFEGDHQSIQADACEFLCLVLNQGNTDLAFVTVEDALRSVLRYMEAKDDVMQLLLLNVLEVIFFSCKLDSDPAKLSSLLNSQLFREVYLNCTNTEDSYACNHWTTFLIQSFPMILSSIKPPELDSIIDVLIENFCSLIRHNEECDGFLTGLQKVIHSTLSLTENAQVEQAAKPQKKTNLFQGFFKIFTGDGQAEQENPLANTIGCVFRKLRGVIDVCLSILPENEVLVTPSGMRTYTPATAQSPLKQKEVLKLLSPIAKRFPNEFMQALMEMWIPRCLEVRDGIQDLDKLVRLCISLNVTPMSYLNSVLEYLTETLKLPLVGKREYVPTEDKELAVVYFTYAVFAFYRKPQLKLEGEVEREIWVKVLELCRLLEYSTVPTLPHWTLELLKLFLEKLSNEALFKDKRLLKELQDFVQKSLTQLTGTACGQAMSLRFPVPPSVYTETLEKLSGGTDVVSIVCLDYCLVFIAQLLWKDSTVLSIPAAPLLQALISNPGMDPIKSLHIAKFLAKLLEQDCDKLAKQCRRPVIDFFSSPEFFSQMTPELLKQWARIVNLVSENCYTDEQLFSELLSKVQTGMFVSADSELIQRIRMLRCIAFVLYSGDQDKYVTASQFICSTLKESMKFDKLLPVVFFCLEVLILRLSQGKLSELWPSIWPHVLTHLMKIMEKADNPSHFLATLKLLQFLILSNNEEFHLYQWIFFNLVDNNNPGGFIPLVNRLVEGEELDEEVAVISDTSIETIEQGKLLAAKLIRKMESLTNERKTDDQELLEKLVVLDFHSEFA